MSSAKTIVKNTSYLFVAEAISRVLSLILIIALARYLGDAGLGKYSFVFAFTYVLIILTDFGLSTYVTKEIAKNREKTDKYFSNLIGLKIVLLLAGLFISIIAAIVIEKSMEITILVALAAIAVLIENLTLTFGIMFTSHERMHYSSLVIVVERVFALSLGFLVLLLGFDLKLFIITLIASRVIAFLVSFFIIQKRFAKIRFEFDVSFWKYLIKSSMPFWFTKLFMSIYYKTDTLMLSFMKGYSVVGWYNASGKLVEALGFIPRLVTLAIFPAMSKFHNKSKELLAKLYRKSFYYLFAIALPAGIGTTLLANRLIMFIYKEEFVNSVPILKILIWASVFMFMNTVMGYLLNAIDKQKLFTLSSGLGALINVILNFILILMYGHIGAAVATVATQAIIFAVLYYFTSKNGYKINLFTITIKPILAGIAMGLSIIYLNKLHLFILIPIAAGIYFLTLFMIGGLGKEEIKLIKNTLNRN